MAYNAIVNLGVQWTPPSAPANSGSSSFVVTASYNEQNVGNIGIPSATPPATDFAIPFGTVGKAKVIVIKSLAAQELELRINGAVTSTFNIPPQGVVAFACSTEPSVDEWASAVVTTTGTNTALETVQYQIFGD
jgi:hypothetical protein